MEYQKAAIGGTFDLLHLGHKSLINKAFEISEKVYIGVVSDNSKLPTSPRLRGASKSQNERIKELTKYLKDRNFFSRAQIDLISDVGGESLTDGSFQAIVVSEQTIIGAKEVNRIRKINNLKPLEIIVIPMTKDENGLIISSTRIRNGEINRQGKVYLNSFKQPIVISKEARRELSRPQGLLIASDAGLKSENNKFIILVGDLVTKTFVDKKLEFSIAIIDGFCERQPVDFFSFDYLNKNVKQTVNNPAGIISPELALAIVQRIKERKGIIKVIGEEDLAAVPAIILSPLNSLVYYGQPKKGMVKVIVTEEIKEKLRQLLI